MGTVYEFLSKGGPVMVPVVGLSVLTLSCALERSWFWWHSLRGEQRLVRLILDAAIEDFDRARLLAENAQDIPIGRFLLAPLKLVSPEPETFRLALEAAADREFAQMRKGDKLLESIVGIAPLLGLLGTVTGLIVTFFNLKIGGGGSGADTSKAALGIAEALITTAAGMLVAVITLAVFRICVSLQTGQMDYFTDVGNELELIYRQNWSKKSMRSNFSQTDQADQAFVDRLIQVLQRSIPPDPAHEHTAHEYIAHEYTAHELGSIAHEKS
jgi:biopolymer transport protein ExbB